MEVGKDLLAAKLIRWESYMRGYSLPAWEELPDLELYMDQVVALVTRYLDILPQANLENVVITPSTINNYVRMKVMPAPVRKKYTKVHLAYLILICLLKQCLSLAEIQVILPMGLSEAEVRTVYDGFAMRLHDTALRFIDQIREEMSGVLEPGGGEQKVETAEELILSTAVSAVLNRLLATKLLALEKKDDGQARPEEDPEPET